MIAVVAMVPIIAIEILGLLYQIQLKKQSKRNGRKRNQEVSNG